MGEGGTGCQARALRAGARSPRRLRKSPVQAKCRKAVSDKLAWPIAKAKAGAQSR